MGRLRGSGRLCQPLAFLTGAATRCCAGRTQTSTCCRSASPPPMRLGARSSGLWGPARWVGGAIGDDDAWWPGPLLPALGACHVYAPFALPACPPTMPRTLCGAGAGRGAGPLLGGGWGQTHPQLPLSGAVAGVARALRVGIGGWAGCPCKRCQRRLRSFPGAPSAKQATPTLKTPSPPTFLRPGCLPPSSQAVKAACTEHVPEADVLLLPLDLVGPYEDLEQVAEAAFEAFGGQGVDYLVHNAGGRSLYFFELAFPSRGWTTWCTMQVGCPLYFSALNSLLRLGPGRRLPGAQCGWVDWVV